MFHVKQSKELQRWEFAVTEVARDEGRVYVQAIDITAGHTRPNDDMEMPIGRFIRMFGRASLQEGQIGWLIIKQRADGTVGIRGWPYRKKWTQEDIDRVEAEANALWDKLHFERCFT